MDIKTFAKDSGGKRSGMVHLSPRHMKPMPHHNVRDYTLPYNVAQVEALANSIEQVGVQQPITVTKQGDDILIVHGETRWRACMLLLDAGRAPSSLLMPCIEEPRGTTEAGRALNVITANNGNPLVASEAAVAIRRAIALGETPQSVAKTVGKSISWVTQTLDFAAAPAEVHTAVKEGKISQSLAAEITRKEGPNAPAVIKETVERAAKTGKKKATKKHVAVASTWSVRAVGGDLMVVTIDGKANRYSCAHFRKLANAIIRSADAVKEGTVGGQMITDRDD